MDKIKQSGIIPVALILFGALHLHLVPAALIGMLVFILTQRLGNKLKKHMPESKARLLAAVLMVILIITLITMLTMYLSQALGSEENLAGLAIKVGNVLTEMHVILPKTLVNFLPQSLIELKESFGIMIKEHGKEIGTVGKESLHSFAHILIALAIGVILSLQHFVPLTKAKPLAAAMRGSLSLLSRAFENVVFSQVKISAINTMLTSLFLLLVLPLAGVHLPYSKTLIAITFFVGLLPIIGNLISNTLIVLISLGVSFKVGLSALIFLVTIHKLEYFINAKIIGARIQASAWELLLAMLVMETIFGMFGLILAPIVYAYFKSELMHAQLI